jgi:hypothetical protein
MKIQVSQNACDDFTQVTDCVCYEEAAASVKGIFRQATPLDVTPELKKKFRKWGKKPVLYQHGDWILVLQNDVVVCVNKI